MDRSAQRVLIALTAATCVVVTALLIVDMVQSRRQPMAATNGDPLRGGSASPSLFEQPLPLREFSLTDHTGQPFGSTQLKGKVWIASFVFTRCTTVCPRVIAQTAELQKSLPAVPGGSEVVLISISVDPKFDTPAVLSETAKLWEADDARWRFLTDGRDKTRDIISAPDGFRDHVGDAAPGAAMSVSHSSRFVLVDRNHRIRGYYDALDEEKRAELLRDVKRLLE